MTAKKTSKSDTAKFLSIMKFVHYWREHHKYSGNVSASLLGVNPTIMSRIKHQTVKNISTNVLIQCLTIIKKYPEFEEEAKKSLAYLQGQTKTTSVRPISKKEKKPTSVTIPSLAKKLVTMQNPKKPTTVVNTVEVKKTPKEYTLTDRRGVEFDTYVASTYLNKKKNAYARGLDFDISLTAFMGVYRAKKCQLTGIDLVLKKVESGETPPKNLLTIDRIDYNKGYIEGNIMAVSHVANSMKALVEFRDLNQGVKPLGYDFIINMGKKLQQCKDKGML